MIYETEAVYEEGLLRLSKNIPVVNGTRVKVLILVTKEDRVKVALELLRRGEVSVGLAARIAGLSYREFLEEMRKHNVEFPYDKEELEEDLSENNSG
mgnify:CR=1 FL=1